MHVHIIIYCKRRQKPPLNPLESSSVLSSSQMDEIRLFTATRVAAAGLATAGAMAAAVNKASLEAGRIVATGSS